MPALARHRFSVPLLTSLLLALSAAALVLGAPSSPAWSQWSGAGSTAATPVVVRGDVWYLRNSNTAGVANMSFTYGNPGDLAVMGDWNGDGTDTPGVVRGNTSYLRNSNTTGIADITFTYGNPGDRLLGERAKSVPGSEEPLERGNEGPSVAQLQGELERLGFWVGPKDGIFGNLTEQAVYAVQKYAGLPITGVVDSATRERINSGPPVQAATTTGDIIEIDKFRQLVFIVRGGRTVWAFNASTGNEEPYVYGGQQYDAVTPTGRFEIFRQVDGWEESHLGELYRSKYFTYNGIALHGSTFVPPYAASHGCVRVTIDAMDYLWQQELAPIGIDVWVYGSLPN